MDYESTALPLSYEPANISKFLYNNNFLNGLSILFTLKTSKMSHLCQICVNWLLRVRQEDLVDSVVIDAFIYNPSGPHLGVFPGPLLKR